MNLKVWQVLEVTGRILILAAIAFQLISIMQITESFSEFENYLQQVRKIDDKAADIIDLALERTRNEKHSSINIWFLVVFISGSLLNIVGRIMEFNVSNKQL